MQDLKPGKYKHYKGKIYELIGIAKHTETLEELVIYRALYESKDYPLNQLWARPKKMFLEKICIDGKGVTRFEYMGD